MKNTEATLHQLKQQLAELGEAFPKLKDDERFVAWFVRAYLTEDQAQAVDAVVGGAHDKGIDGVFIDDRARAVFVLQAKARHKLNGKLENRDSVLGFARLAEVLEDRDHKNFAGFLRDMEPITAERLREARGRLNKGDYRLNLLFVSMGKFSQRLIDAAKSTVRRAGNNASIELLDGSRLMLLLRDYLDGAAPPIPVLDLELEASSSVQVNGVLQRYDTKNSVESWVVSMSGASVADLFEVGGPRLFARNIRGFLGESTPINMSMADTLRHHPDKFFYFNNGITIVCDQAERIGRGGRDVLRVSNPQVINGQQTTRMLALEAAGKQRASVLVKVMRVPREGINVPLAFDEFVSDVVQGTNWQNAIRASDLMANDRRQIELEKGLRRLDYFYLRKRQTKGEAKRLMKGKRYTPVTKEELAQAVAGCEMDPVVPRSGKDNLFTEEYYKKIFPNSDPLWYLPRLLLSKSTTTGARSYPQRGYAKWLVLGFCWARLAPTVRSAGAARHFIDLWRSDDTRLHKRLDRIVDQTFAAAIRYYNANKGRGKKATDISLFFRSKKGRHLEFLRFWRQRPRSWRRGVDKAWEQLSQRVSTL